MDNRNFAFLFEMNARSENIYFTKDISQFLSDYIDGSLTNYWVDDFFNNHSDYVTSVKYLPLDVRKWITSGNLHPQVQILLGKSAITSYNNFYDIYPERWNPKIVLFTKTINHIFNNFLDYAPYTKLKLYVPYFEMIELDNDIVMGNTITAYVSLDVHTGILTLYIECSGLLIDTKTANVGIDISLGRTNEEDIKRNNTLRAISLLGTGAGMIAGNGNPVTTAGGIGLLTKNITGALSDNVTRLKSYKGGSGNRTELVVDKSVQLIIEKPSNVRFPSDHLKGRPCRKNLALSGVTGYTEIGEIHFNPKDVLIYDDEINEITELLRAGVIL